MKNRVKRSLAWIIMIVMTALIGISEIGPTSVYAETGSALSVYKGNQLVKEYSMDALQSLAAKEGDKTYMYSAYNRNPSYKFYSHACGPTIEAILQDAGIAVSENQLLTFIAPDQAQESFTAADLLGERYYFPNESSKNATGEAAGAEEYQNSEVVPAIIDLSNSDDEGALRFGQKAPNEQNASVYLKYIAGGGTLIVGDEQNVSWPAITNANYSSGVILPETELQFDISEIAGKKMAVYYTTDGTKPTYGDAIYNYDKYGGTRTIQFEKEGTYTIKLKVIGYGKQDSEIATFTYTVKDVDSPAVPTGFTATATSLHSVQLKWNAVADANGYEIFKYNGSTYEIENDVKNCTSYLDEELDFGTYKYKVRAYKLLSSGQKVYSSATAVKTATLSLGKPTLTSVTRSGYNSIQLKWSKVAGATGYEIWRYDSVTKKWARVKAISKQSTVSWKNTGLKTGRKYTYKICAVEGNNSSAFSATKAATPTLSKPAVSKLTAGKKCITVKWSKVTGASGYKIYRSTKKNSGYKVVKTVKSGTTVSWKNTGLKKGTKYYYKVKAYRIVDKKYVYSSISSSKYTKSK